MGALLRTLFTHREVLPRRDPQKDPARVLSYVRASRYNRELRALLRKRYGRSDRGYRCYVRCGGSSALDCGDRVLPQKLRAPLCARDLRCNTDPQKCSSQDQGKSRGRTHRKRPRADLPDRSTPCCNRVLRRRIVQCVPLLQILIRG